MRQDPTKKLHRHSLGMVRLKVRGFRQFQKEIDIELGQVNVFVGPNGSGKSTITKLIRLLHETYQKEIQHLIPAGLTWEMGLAMSPGDQFEFDIDFADENYRLYRHKLRYHVELAGNWKLFDFTLALANSKGQFQKLIISNRGENNKFENKLVPSGLKNLLMAIHVREDEHSISGYRHVTSVLNEFQSSENKGASKIVKLIEAIISLRQQNPEVGFYGQVLKSPNWTVGEMERDFSPHMRLSELGKEINWVSQTDLNFLNEAMIKWFKKDENRVNWFRSYEKNISEWSSKDLYYLLIFKELDEQIAKGTTRTLVERVLKPDRHIEAICLFEGIRSISLTFESLIKALLTPQILWAESPYSQELHEYFEIYSVNEEYALKARVQPFTELNPAVSALLKIVEKDRECKGFKYRTQGLELPVSKVISDSKFVVKSNILNDTIILELDQEKRSFSVKLESTDLYLSDLSYGEQRAFFLELFLREDGILFFEEPEAGLHPRFQAILGKVILKDLFESSSHHGVSGNAAPFESIEIAVDQIDEYSHSTWMVKGDSWSVGARLAFVETHSEYFIRAIQLGVAERFKDFPHKATKPIRGIKIFYIEKDKRGNSCITDMGLRFDGMLSKSFGPGFFDESISLAMKLLDLHKMN